MIIQNNGVGFDEFVRDNPALKDKAMEAREELKSLMREKFVSINYNAFQVVTIDGFPCVIYIGEGAPFATKITAIPFNSNRVFLVQEIELAYRFSM